MKLEKYDIIILDCDGVIFNSNLLKIEAFKAALSEYDEKIVHGFIEYFKKSFGSSRYKLVKVFLEEFLECGFNEVLYRSILEKYSQGCIGLYQKADLTEYFIEFIEFYKDKSLYVASGSDEEELIEVFENRDLKKNFVKIFGSPKAKNDIVVDIVNSQSGSFVMIGDALTDKLAAENSKIDFIFMKDYSTNIDMKKDNSFFSINNLGDLI